MPTLRERLIWWLGLNVGLALTPLLFNAFSGSGVGWETAIGHGELILVAVAIAGLSLASTAIASPANSALRELRALLAIAGIIFVLSAGLLYADNFRALADGGNPSVEAKSYFLFGLAVVLGTSTVYLGHKVEEERSR
jgi:uncharacterized membrane protein